VASGGQELEELADLGDVRSATKRITRDKDASLSGHVAKQLPLTAGTCVRICAVSGGESLCVFGRENTKYASEMDDGSLTDKFSERVKNGLDRIRKDQVF